LTQRVCGVCPYAHAEATALKKAGNTSLINFNHPTQPCLAPHQTGQPQDPIAA